MTDNASLQRAVSSPRHLPPEIPWANSSAARSSSSLRLPCSSPRPPCAPSARVPSPTSCASPASPSASSPSCSRSEEHTSELQSRLHLVCRLLLEKKKQNTN